MMRVTVLVKLKAGRVRVEAGHPLKVFLTRPAEDGRANRQLIEVLAEHFGVGKYRVAIITGKTARTKIVEIADEDHARRGSHS